MAYTGYIKDIRRSRVSVDLHRDCDNFGAEEYRVRGSDGFITSPQAGALYRTFKRPGTVAAMGCDVTFSGDATRNWSSVTLVPWAAKLTALGQACPFHVSVSRTGAGLYFRTAKGGPLTQVETVPLGRPFETGEVRPVSVSIKGHTITVTVGDQTAIRTNDGYGVARGIYPCFETYIGDPAQDGLPWMNNAWVEFGS